MNVRKAAAIPFLALALTACGPAESADQKRDVATVTGEKGAGDSKDATQKKLHEFGECMRAAGFTVEDPTSADDLKLPPEAGTREARAKTSKCFELLPAAEPVKADPKKIAEQLTIARCMRDHGVPEAQDPDELGTIMYVPAVDFSTTRFKKASKACTGEEGTSTGAPVG